MLHSCIAPGDSAMAQSIARLAPREQQGPGLAMRQSATHKNRLGGINGFGKKRFGGCNGFGGLFSRPHSSAVPLKVNSRQFICHSRTRDYPLDPPNRFSNLVIDA